MFLGLLLSCRSFGSRSLCPGPLPARPLLTLMSSLMPPLLQEGLLVSLPGHGTRPAGWLLICSISKLGAAQDLSASGEQGNQKLCSEALVMMKARELSCGVGSLLQGQDFSRSPAAAWRESWSSHPRQVSRRGTHTRYS